MSLTVRMTGLDDYLDGGSGRIKALILGPPGSGKTRSAGAGWPKPLLADCEEGRMSVADRAIPYAAIKSSADMKALLTLAEEESKRPKDQQRFQTLIIDTLDAYQRIVTQEYLRANKKASMSGWQDWGHLDAEMTELVARLSGISMNVVVNLHVKDTKVGGSDDGDGGILVKSPKLKGDLRDQIAAEFDLVGFMETGWEAVDGKRALSRYVQWEPSPDKPILKDRSGQLPSKTPVTFTEEDYLGLLRPLEAAMEKLKTGVAVAEVATPEPVDPVLVTKGGPVGNVAKAATATAEKTAAPKPAATAAPKPATAAPSAPPVPPVTTPVPAATVPLIETKAVPVTAAEAVATVTEVLGRQLAKSADATLCLPESSRRPNVADLVSDLTQSSPTGTDPTGPVCCWAGDLGIEPRTSCLQIADHHARGSPSRRNRGPRVSRCTRHLTLLLARPWHGQPVGGTRWPCARKSDTGSVSRPPASVWLSKSDPTQGRLIDRAASSEANG
jgi:AAA domain